ncbi:crossover junction endodeoxyribonuclease RuvC [Sphaerochaeta sp.]|jgi:crossover junction endodeoxyribonuclease RuvC|uniref:crossover junction endodeoxyribonuclease RuvC n=1 Tax=Sphaerochaeta sp. TaxID=1972642 RepID=UPI002FC95809
MRILGIDPGYAQTGWGVVESDGQHNRPVSFGVIKTATSQSDSQRIHFIAKAVGELAIEHHVAICGMEDIFFTKNISSAIPVAKVIGACIHQLSLQDIPVRLYSPPTIKTVVTGYGGAEKHQVQEMVRILLGFESIPRPDHAADALAAALCLAVYDFTQIRMNMP